MYDRLSVETIEGKGKNEALNKILLGSMRSGTISIYFKRSEFPIWNAQKLRSRDYRRSNNIIHHRSRVEKMTAIFDSGYTYCTTQ